MSDEQNVHMDGEQQSLAESNQLITNEKGDVSMLAELFADQKPGVILGGQNQLKMTARLTTLSEQLANQVWEVVSSDPVSFESKVRASQQSHDAMDDLVNECVDLGAVDVDFLERVTEEETEKMIRSQQSKRSRAKSKVMTKENYMTMLVGAVAENLLRISSGKHKTIGGGAIMGEIGFSAEDLEMLANDRDALTKAIRNVQSKKSIMKSKKDFDPQHHRWLQLLAAEQQLKEVRDRGTSAVVKEAEKILETKKQTEELLAGVDTENLTPEEAKSLLDSIREMLASK